MKRRYHINHKLLRAFMTLFVFIAISAISVVYVEAKEPLQSIIDEISPEDIHSVTVNKDKNLITIIKNDGTEVSSNPNDHNITSSDSIKKSTPQIAPSVDARRDQLFLTSLDRNNKPIYVVRCKNHTKVYIGIKVHWDRHWYVLSEDMALIDPATNDKYILHSSGTGLPLAKAIWVNNLKDRYIYNELIFPPLDKSVDKVEFIERIKASTTEGYGNRGNVIDGGIGWHFQDVEVEKRLPDFASDKYQAELNKEPRVIKLDSNFRIK